MKRVDYRWVCAVPAALLLAACGGTETTETTPEDAPPLEAQAFEVRSVGWNPSAVDVGSVAAVAELGGTTAVFSSTGASVFSGGVLTATDAAVTNWASAAVIPAADANGVWIAGINETGQIFRLRAGSFFESVSDLYGLEDDAILGAVALGGPAVTFALQDQLAVTDGTTITRYDAGTFVGMAGGGGRVASAGGDKAQVFEVGSAKSYAYDMEGAEQVAFDAAGRLIVRTADAIYIEGDGKLVLRYQSTGGTLRGFAASDLRIWFIEGSELGALEADAVYLTADAGIAEDTRLLGSPSGDVWTLSGGGLARHAAELGDSEDRKVWEEEVQPIFLASCTPCHEPGGSSGTDLSTYGAWVALRKTVNERVVETKTMPPEGIPIDDADREVIAAWVAGASP